MSKIITLLLASTFFTSSHAMQNEDVLPAKSLITLHEANLEEVVEQQKNILSQMVNLQTQLDLLNPNFQKLLNSSELIIEQKKKKAKERFTSRLQHRITQAGENAVQEEKKRWKIEKVNKYRLHREKVNLEITRATDEGRTKSIINGMMSYEPTEIYIEKGWLTIAEFRKKRNEDFDNKQRKIKEELLGSRRREAEKYESTKIYNEEIKDIKG